MQGPKRDEYSPDRSSSSRTDAPINPLPTGSPPESSPESPYVSSSIQSEREPDIQPDIPASESDSDPVPNGSATRELQPNRDPIP